LATNRRGAAPRRHGGWSPAATAVRPTAVGHERRPMQPPWATTVGWFF
jgi:hypothetical protein